MADFIAVIRRAVDGLSDNTPEMRIRVYDRARSAVQRQLDNMKPRPADDVIARQLEKLDEAIAAIESEFTGAPKGEPEAAVPVLVDEAPVPPPPPEPEPQPLTEPAPRDVVAPKPASAEPPAFLVRAPEPVVEKRVEPKPEPVFEREPEPKIEPAPTPADSAPVEPEHPTPTPEDDTMPPPEAAVPDRGWQPAPVEPVEPWRRDAAEPEKSWRSEAVDPDTTWRRERFDEPLGLREPARGTERNWDVFGRDTGQATPAAEPGTEAADAWNPTVTDNPFHEPAEIFTPKMAAEPATRPASRLDDPYAFERPTKSAVEPKSWLDEMKAPAIPAASPQSARDASWDSFEAFVGERSGAATAPDVTPRGRDGMSIGVQEPPRETAKAAPPREDREGRGRLIAGIAAALIVLAGVGYAGWRFSDDILGLVNGVSSGSSQTAKSEPPAAQTSQPAATPSDGKPANTPTTPVATGPQKFTQRLMSDGSEVDTGASAEQVASAGQAEGKSVANQNEKPPAQPAATQAPAQPATTPATTGQNDTTAAPQAATMKMFLYEERLGQASPTALEGTVTWSVKTDDQNGHNEKMIQGDISVPGRKMSAIFTLRKNNDPTLPASHIIELTFSLPKEFEGRGIESVLRISMKDKEQEQGDPLVAVPAKITDYFHMVALNAFAEAVKTNLNLLKTRDWIDIPVTYSNGRRALLTLQKGPEGRKIFDDVIASWEVSGDSSVPTPSTPPAQ